MAVKTLQVTQTGSAVQFTTVPTFARWICLQNTGGATATVGDANVTATRGILLAATTGQLYLDPLGDVSCHYDLSQFWTIGTNTQVLSVTYDSMN